MSFLTGAQSVKFTHSPHPLILPSKNNGPTRALSELVKDITPTCNLNPFLFNGHLQTAWTAMKYDGPHVHYKRRVFAAEDPAFKGHFTVDFVVADIDIPYNPKSTAEDGGKDDAGLREDPTGVGHNRLPPRTTYFTNKEFNALGSDDTKPLLITLHGLSGGSYEVYLRHVLHPLIVATAEGAEAGGLSGGDWEALVVNSRGCAGSKITSSILYNARSTWDVRQVVKWARKKWPNRPLYGIGFSLGANIITNYIGEEGTSCELSAAISFCNPFALDISHRNLLRTYLGREIYSKTMGTSMRTLFEEHAEVMLHNPALDVERIRNIKYLFEFDREVQCASWGYATESAYYRDASSSDSVLSVKIPYLAIHAEDDPIACDEAVPYEEIRANPYTVLLGTSGGGHLGGYELGGARWFVKPAVAFLNAMWREVDSSKIIDPARGKVGLHGGHGPFTFEPMRRKAYVRDFDV
nr:putative esterase [Quercus suber]